MKPVTTAGIIETITRELPKKTKVPFTASPAFSSGPEIVIVWVGTEYQKAKVEIALEDILPAGTPVRVDINLNKPRRAF